MLKISLPELELWDGQREEFIYIKPQTLTLEHSLLSISKWESKWCKPFLVNTPPKTREETVDYIKCMTINQGVDPRVYDYMPDSAAKQIQEYLNRPMTATVIKRRATGRSSEQVTSELIYYWMTALNIPFECEKWNLNRLLTLIDVCSIKNQPPKKMSSKAILSQNAALNAARCAKLHTKG